MKHIVISKDLKLPVETAATQTYGFIARKGAGKTYTAGKMVEGLLDSFAQVVVFDPVGNWWGLRIASDGKGSGYDIPVFGGLRGDVPIEPEAGALVADLVVDKNISAVLDVSQFNQSERRRFYTAFSTQLFQRRKAQPSPTHLVFEEAQLFAPQKPQKGDEKMGYISEQLVRLGRNFGIGASLITQRPQAVSKEVLNQVECLFVLQTSGPHERKALKEWITEHGMEKELVDSLPKLPVGVAYVWSPQWLDVCRKITINKKKTFDASATPVIRGKAVAAPGKLANTELQALKEAMAEVVERRESEDPTRLRKRIRELEKQVAESGSGEFSKQQVEEMVRAEIERIEERWDAWSEQYNDYFVKVLEGLPGYIREQMKNSPVAPTSNKPEGSIVLREKPTRSAAPAVIPSQVQGLDGLSKSAEKMLRYMVKVYPLKMTRKQMAIQSGFSIRSSSFRPNVKSLIDGGFIIESEGMVAASESSVDQLGDQSHILCGNPDAVLNKWKSVLKPSAANMLQALVDCYPESLHRESIADAAGVSRTSSSLGASLKDLVDNGLADKTGQYYMASSNLIPGKG